MSDPNSEPEREQQGRQININLSRNTIVLLVTFLALALMIVLVFFIPVGPRSGEEATPNTNVTVTGQQSATPAVVGGQQPGSYPGPSATTGAVAEGTPAGGGAYPGPAATSLPEPTQTDAAPPVQTGAISGTAVIALAPTALATATGAGLAATITPAIVAGNSTAYPGPNAQPGLTATVPPFNVTQQPGSTATPELPAPTLSLPTANVPPTPLPLPPTDILPPTSIPAPTNIPPPTDIPPPTNTRAPTNTPQPTAIPVDVVRGNVRWTPANGPIILRRDLHIPAGSRLTIDPGTEVRVAEGVSIYVDGQLQAFGRPDAPVRFGAAGAPSQRWSGIFGNAGSDIELASTEIAGAGAGGTMLVSEAGTLTIKDSRLSGNGGNILVNDSRLEIRNTEIAGNDMPFGAALEATYTGGNGVILAGNRIGGNRLQEGAPGVRITSNSAVDTLNLDIQRNLITSAAGGGNLILSTNGALRGSLTCNTLVGDSIGLDLRTETKQIPGFDLKARDNFIDAHTPPIIPEYLRYGIGRGAASEVALDMRGNWWGDASGPYDPELNQLGRGDAVGDNIDYAGWLTSAPSCAPRQ